MIPANLKVERVKRGMTQEQLAGELGISRSYVALIETNREVPGQELAAKMENYFNKPVDYLLRKVEL